MFEKNIIGHIMSVEQQVMVQDIISGMGSELGLMCKIMKFGDKYYISLGSGLGLMFKIVEVGDKYYLVECAPEGGKRQEFTIFQVKASPLEREVIPINSPYLLRMIDLTEDESENDEIEWILASRSMISFDSWVKRCEGKEWKDVENEFRSIFRCITRGLIHLYDIGICHGNLLEGVAITDDNKAKLFGIKRKGTSDLVTDSKDLGKLMWRIFELVGVNMNELPPDLSNLYKILTSEIRWNLEMMQWNLEIAFFLTSEERVCFLKEVVAQLHSGKEVRLGRFNTAFKARLSTRKWKHKIPSTDDLHANAWKVDESTQDGQAPIYCFSDDSSGLFNFVKYTLEDHVEVSRLEGKISSFFPNFFPAVKFAVQTKPNETHYLHSFRICEKLEQRAV